MKQLSFRKNVMWIGLTTIFPMLFSLLFYLLQRYNIMYVGNLWITLPLILASILWVFAIIVTIKDHYKNKSDEKIE
jgi:hypothetical protein